MTLVRSLTSSPASDALHDLTLNLGATNVIFEDTALLLRSVPALRFLSLHRVETYHPMQMLMDAVSICKQLAHFEIQGKLSPHLPALLTVLSALPRLGELRLSSELFKSHDTAMAWKIAGRCRHLWELSFTYLTYSRADDKGEVAQAMLDLLITHPLPELVSFRLPKCPIWNPNAIQALAAALTTPQSTLQWLYITSAGSWSTQLMQTFCASLGNSLRNLSFALEGPMMDKHMQMLTAALRHNYTLVELSVISSDSAIGSIVFANQTISAFFAAVTAHPTIDFLVSRICPLAFSKMFVF
jgi:hypothetical protein